MKMKLFRYGYLIRIAFDHGRIFPIIVKQRGVSNFIAGISSHIIEAPTTIWGNLLNFDQQARILIHALFAGWGNQLYLGISSILQPEFLIQRIFG
jgi:hypothetical protein